MMGIMKREAETLPSHYLARKDIWMVYMIF